MLIVRRNRNGESKKTGIMINILFPVMCGLSSTHSSFFLFLISKKILGIIFVQIPLSLVCLRHVLSSNYGPNFLCVVRFIYNMF